MSAFFVENFGCRAAQADGAAIERDLAAQGLTRADAPNNATVAVLNTCTVTAAADADVRASIRRIHRENPECKILVTGCYAQRAPEEVAALPGVTWVVGNSHKREVAGIIQQSMGGQRDPSPSAQNDNSGIVSLGQLTGHSHLPEADMRYVGDIFAHTQLLAAAVFESGTSSAKTRPNLKVQDGCDNRCSFCIIPFVRGNSRSLALDDVIRECDALVAAGYKEVVLSGINLGRWGRDLDSASRFEDLIESILQRTSLERLRISSVEPMDWSDRLIALMADSPRVCKHAHVPLQSGSDRVLRMMHRKYRPWHYAEKIRKILEAMPEAAIGADVMVGFPGETEELFAENFSFIEQLPFTYLHVFTYSSRPGTAAAKMPDHVPVQVARKRNRVLRELIAEKNRKWRERFVGRELEAITLHSQHALTNNFVRLELEEECEANQLIRVKIVSVTEDGLWGKRL